MFQALIILLREGVEAALVIGIAVAYLRKTSHDALVRFVYLALAAAFVSSVALGYGFARMEWNHEKFEGWVLLAAAAMVVTLAVWMMRTGKRMKQEVESSLLRASGRAAAALGVFIFVYLMVLREGVESVLMLSAVALTSEGLLTVAGAALGLTLSVVFGVLFVRGSLRIDLRKFFRVTTAILFFVAGQLLVTGLHELSEQGVLPSSRTEMAVIGPIVRNDVFFFLAMLALASLMVLLDARGRPMTIAVDTGSAARRKQRWQARRERLWSVSVCTAAFLFMTIVTAEFIYAKSQLTLSSATVLTAVDGIVRVPIAEIEDGGLHRYRFGKTRFIVIQRPGMTPGVALDACEICGDVGYYQKGLNVFCKNCAAALFIPSIGVSGGCNPIPLKHRVEDGAIVIDASQLQQQERFFTASITE